MPVVRTVKSIAAVLFGFYLSLPHAALAQVDEAAALNQQVLQLYSQGRYSEAIPLAQRALTIREKALGADHPDVAVSLNNLAVADAKQSHKRALTIREKALGPNHPDVALSLNNLAGIDQAQGRYAEAEPLYKRSLAIREKALSPDHPDVAQALNNLAELYRGLGRYADAEPLYKRSPGKGARCEVRPSERASAALSHREATGGARFALRL
jgi:tetratricopeptide (TPR) repeat protein